MVLAKEWGIGVMPPRSQQAQHLAGLIDSLISNTRRIERQRVLIRDLERDGKDTTKAHKMLALLEEFHANYTHEKDRLIAELAQEPEEDIQGAA
jgi:hypothetical protein